MVFGVGLLIGILAESLTQVVGLVASLVQVSLPELI